MEVALQSSPHATHYQNRFMVLRPSKRSLKLYEAEQVKGRNFRYKQISQHTDFTTARVFDWSPADEAIVGVGLVTGEAALLRIDDSSNGLLAFNFKTPRPCTTLALSPTGLLAAGMEKARNDASLSIWDINHRLSTWDRKSKGWASTRPQYEPMRKLASPDAISNVKFFTDVPDTLIAGSKGLHVRIYDLRAFTDDPTISFPTRCAQNVTIDGHDENYIASSSSAGEPVVCIWDRRAGQHSSATILSSGHGRHSTPGPVLELRDCFDGSDSLSPPLVSCLRFCKSKRGTIGVLSSRGQLKVYETAKEYAGGGTTTRASHSSRNVKDAQRLFTRTSRDVEGPYHDRYEAHSDNRRIESFDFLISNPLDEKYNMVVCRANGSLEAIELRPPPSIVDESPKGEVAIGAPSKDSGFRNGHGVYPHIDIRPSTSENMTIAQTLENIRTKVRSARRMHKGTNEASVDSVAEHSLSSRERRLVGLDLFGPPGFQLPFEDVLTLGTVERRRAQEGYLFDCAKNIQILSDDSGLQELWAWIQGAKILAKKGGMTHKQLDLSYLGVHSAWNADVGPTPSRRTTAEDGRPPTKKEFVEAAQRINKRHKNARFGGAIKTAYPDLRQLCLFICGWVITEAQFEAELQRLLTEEARTKAAAYAVFHGYTDRAIEVVLKGDDSEKLVAMALAAFYHTAGTTKEGDSGAWSALCDEIIEKAQDPWSKALLTLVSTESWDVVIRETSLPLRDRIGVALRALEDDELTRYLDEITRDCIEHGDIEGIWLTGITPETTDLFQEYITTTNDIQTAVLVMSHSIPAYFDDHRFEHWRNTYCHRLDMYELHVERCLYTQQHAKRSLTREGRSLIKPIPRQVTLRCTYCDQNVINNQDHDADILLEASITSTDVTAVESSSSGVHPGNPLNVSRPEEETTCPSCGRRLPRCGVCMMWLGKTDARPVIHNSHPHYRKPSPSFAAVVVVAGTLNKDVNVGVNVDENGHDPFARTLNFCNTCHHGFHAHHARDWFAIHRMCPVPECECLCAAYGP
ncbi:MAG: hypothetical protein M1816_000190 [Peltula sp. TS41687]|nr:MAG: hypothetical protein M1816_000190 [Peltula sp. TS41687]